MTVLWSPEKCIVDDNDFLKRVDGMVYDGRPPFDSSLLELLALISKKILSSPSLRLQPQYVALAYWLRPAAVSKMVNHWVSEEQSGRMRSPRGVAIHFPPTNVDTIFVYSWAVSVLAGNCNIVRIPSNVGPIVEELLVEINDALLLAGDMDRHIFCNFSYDGELNSSVSAHCDLRLIWGGDAKVAAVNRVPIRPDGISLGFSDRNSFAVLNSHSYAMASDKERDQLAGNLFNDIYWFDQMGCGSPRVIYWVGDPASLSEDLFSRLASEAERKNYQVEAGTGINKFILANELLAEDHAISASRFGSILETARIQTVSPLLARKQGGGFLGEMVVENIEELNRYVDRKTQTISHFGFGTQDLKRLAGALLGLGGYRLVPIGNALQFGPVWDGVDLMSHMTRQVVYN